MLEPSRNNPIPLYHQLRLWIEGQISTGVYTPGAMLPSERELCERFRLSNITVRKALSELVHAGVIYRQNGVGSFVSTPSKRLRIALVVIGYGETWWRSRGIQFSALLGGIAKVTCEIGSQFTMVYLNSVKDLPEFIGSVVDERSFDGLLIRPLETISASDVEALEARSMPYVLIRARSLSRPANCVQLADEEEGYLATRHLTELGHDRIAFVGGGNSNPILVDRLHGYQRALAEAGVSFEKGLFRDGQLLQTGDAAGRGVISGLLGASPPPTALLVATSPLVRWTYYAIRDRGLRIPEDISVVGADEDVGGMAMTPTLTRFGRSHFDLGVSAAEFLIDLIANGMGKPREIVLPPCFQAGGSSAGRPLPAGSDTSLFQISSR